MARILKPPIEIQVQCPHCTSLVAYSKLDVKGGKSSKPPYIFCPNCTQHISIPSWPESPSHYLTDVESIELA